MKRYIKPASELIDLEMGVMIAASIPDLDNAENNKDDAVGGRSPIWRHMENDGNDPLFWLTHPKSHIPKVWAAQSVVHTFFFIAVR